MFEIYDRHTGAVVGSAKTAQSARRVVDRRDNAYGGYRFNYRPISPVQEAPAAIQIPFGLAPPK